MAKAFVAHDYQHAIREHQLGLARGATWAGMGTGKTVSTLTALQDLQLVDARPALILAPLRVAASTWPDEAAKWNHLSGFEVQPLVGDLDARKRALRNSNAAAMTINYEQLVWLTEYLGDRWPFATVIADESTRLKSFRTRQGGARARAIGRIAHTKIARWQNLTGTPAPNGLKDLWGQQFFVDAGQRLGRSFSAFSDRWFHPDKSGYGMIPFEHSQDEIEALLRDVCLTVTAPWAPEPRVVDVWVDLPPRARALYNDMEKTYFAQIDASTEVEAFNAAAKSQKLLQFAAGTIYTDDKGAWNDIHDAKIAALESVFEEAAGMPVLVSYHWKPTLAKLLKAFPKGRVLDDDPQTIRDWNAGKIPYMYAHPASCGHGLNLQDGGNILARYDWWWDFEQYDQILERIGPRRQQQSGHDRAVFDYHILARNTQDITVRDRHRSKCSVQDALLEAMKRR